MSESFTESASLPTTSAPWAMQRYAKARRAELEALLDRVPLMPGAIVVDIQAAGGFVADEIHRRLGGRVECICVEPSEALRSRIAAVHTRCADEVHRLTSIADASADVAVALAGLHHSASARETVCECFRVLKPGGTIALCDVAPDSNVASWLNDFVDLHNPAGHHGVFYSTESVRDMLLEAGFTRIEVEPVDVPWRFASEEDLYHFFGGLFGIHCDKATLHAGVAQHLEVATDADGVSVAWRLIYAKGQKPG